MKHGFIKVLAGPARLMAILSSLIAVGLLTGCAFSRTPVQVTFAPAISQPVKAPGKAALEVGEIRDTRLVGDPMVLLHKSNAYGPTSGAYVTDVPLAKIFGDGLKRALEQNAFMGTNGLHYELRGEIQNFGFGAIQNGVFSSLTSKTWLTVRFELVDKAKGLPVWHDTFNGQATGTLSAWTGGDASDVGRAFSEGAQDVVKQLISDLEFRNYFE